MTAYFGRSARGIQNISVLLQQFLRRAVADGGPVQEGWDLGVPGDLTTSAKGGFDDVAL
jgi:hypothetical protein